VSIITYRPPTYAEIIAEEEELKEDEEELERASLFETKYNFRFEEPTAAIVSTPLTSPPPPAHNYKTMPVHSVTIKNLLIRHHLLI